MGSHLPEAAMMPEAATESGSAHDHRPLCYTGVEVLERSVCFLLGEESDLDHVVELGFEIDTALFLQLFVRYAVLSRDLVERLAAVDFFFKVVHRHVEEFRLFFEHRLMPFGMRHRLRGVGSNSGRGRGGGSHGDLRINRRTLGSGNSECGQSQTAGDGQSGNESTCGHRYDG